MKVVYDWLKEYVGEEMPDVKTVETLLTFHAFEVDGIEIVEDRTVIDVKVLPDRSSDCLSHRGIAREISALIDVPLANDPFTQELLVLPRTDSLAIVIESGNACERFALARMTGITVKESPAWLKERLIALGQRPINNIVDATNYVMFALGQPLHAYDAQKLSHENGVWKCNVRMARDGEQITTLSHETCILDNTMQLVVDAVTDTPLSIAGVKGGIYAQIDTTTTDIILEAGNFNPQITRKTAQKLKLQTDASRRFENNISPALCIYGLTHVIALITEIAGGVCEGVSDVHPRPPSPKNVPIMHAHIESLLGIAIGKDVIQSIFRRLGFTYITHHDGWEVTAPFERTDICIPEDIIADVGRIYGYEHISTVVPNQVPLTELNQRQLYSDRVRDILIAEGCSEVITSSFHSHDEIKLLNALASDKEYLRSSLVPNMEEVLNKNIVRIDLLGLTRIQAFEIGTVFERTPDGRDVTEHTELVIGVRTKLSGPTPKDDECVATLQTILETKLGVQFVATITQGILTCNFSSLITALPLITTPDPFIPVPECTFTPYSLYPFVSRDIALWVHEGVTADAVASYIKAEGSDLLVRTTLIDTFTKDTRTSYAFRLIFQSHAKTLTDDEISPLMERITTTLNARGFEVR